MKILITHPYCWPYVRRGSERFISELSGYLAQRGHDVTVLSTSPVGREEESVAGVRVVRELEVRPRRLAAIEIFRPESGFTTVCRKFLRHNSFDVIHCLHHADVLGAMRESSARRTPCIFHITGIPFARWIRRRPWETAITRAAVRHAARVLLVSNYAGDEFRRLFPKDAHKSTSLPIPCHLSTFAGQNVPRDPRHPIILFMGALTELRKGAQPLARAFNEVKRQLPGARLRYCGNFTEMVKRSVSDLILPEFRDSVEFLGNGRVEDLPRIYAEASVTVLPSVEEAFGMVLVESLASGTPVVGSSDAGMSDIVEPGVGGLFPPQPRHRIATNVQGLTQQILAAIQMHADPSLSKRCQSSAQRFEYKNLGGEYEKVYEDIVGNQKRREYAQLEYSDCA